MAKENKTWACVCMDVSVARRTSNIGWKTALPERRRNQEAKERKERGREKERERERERESKKNKRS